MSRSALNRTLQDLVEALEDGRSGLIGAADQLARAGYHEMAGELRSFAYQRARFSSELCDLAAAHRLVIDQRSTVAAAFHRRWLSLREALSSDKATGVLAEAARGEKHTRRAYGRALKAPLPDDIRGIIEHQAGELATTAQRLSDLTGEPR